MSEKKKGLTYAEAGVDIDAGEREVELIKKSVQATYTRGVMGDIGGFGGLFELDLTGITRPVTVPSEG